MELMVRRSSLDSFVQQSTRRLNRSSVAATAPESAPPSLRIEVFVIASQASSSPSRGGLRRAALDKSSNLFLCAAHSKKLCPLPVSVQVVSGQCWGPKAIHNALIRDASVVGLIPSSSAAPPGPETLPLVALSAARMLSASICRI